MEPVEEVSLLHLVAVLARRRKTIAVVTAGAFVLAATICFMLPGKYIATAKVLPPHKEQAGVAAALGQMAGGLGGIIGGIDGGNSSELYLGILKSRSIADAVVSHLRLEEKLDADNTEDARKKLGKLVKFEAGKEGILTISAVTGSPQLSASIANTFVSELQRKSVQLNLVKAGSDRKFLEQRLEAVRVGLSRAEEELKLFQVANRAIKVDAQAAASIEGIAHVTAEIAAKEVQLASLRSNRTEDNPEVKALAAGIRSLKSLLGRQLGSEKGGAIPSVGSTPSVGLEYARRLREVKTQEAVFEQLTKQLEATKIAEAKDTSTLQVLDEAVAPHKKAGPRTLVIIMAGTLAGLLAAIIVAFVQEYFENIGPEQRRVWDSIRSLRGRGP